MYVRPPDAIIDELLEGKQDGLLDWIKSKNIVEVDLLGVFYADTAHLAIDAAKTIAQSGIVQSVNFQSNRLGKHGPETARNLTGPNSQVRTVVLAYNGLCEHGPETALNLVGPTSQVHTVDLSSNMLGQHGPKTALNLTSAGSQVCIVDLSLNGLYSDGPETALNLTGPCSQVHTVDLNSNGLGVIPFSGPETAENLTRPGSKVHTVNLSKNELKFDGPEVARKLTGPASKVHTVNFCDNDLKEHGPKTLQDFSGPHAKIINLESDEIQLTPEQLHSNLLNILKCPDAQLPKNYSIGELSWIKKASQLPSLQRLSLAAIFKKSEEEALDSQSEALERAIGIPGLQVPLLLYSKHLDAQKWLNQEAGCLEEAVQEYRLHEQTKKIQLD